jgi:drug/metabolite transporter (DMT)-like permease
MIFRRRNFLARWAALPGNFRGGLWMVASGLAFTGLAVNIKVLGGRLPSIEIAFLRCFIAFLAILPLIAATGWGQLRTAHLRIHLWRGGLGIGAMFCSYYAVAHLPLATYTALSFTKPLFATVLAALVLKETVRWRRWSALAVGFLGVLVMVRPGAGTFDPTSLVALADAVTIAALAILVKRLPARETQLCMLFYFGIVSSLGAAVPAALVWLAPSPWEWAMIGAVAMLGLAGQSFFIHAFRAGEASAVAPMDYLRLPLAASIGYAAFAEGVDGWAVAGAGVIVASTIYIARREARVRTRPANS